MAHAEVQQGTPDFDTRLIFVISLVAAVLFFTVIVAIWAGFEFVWNQEVYEKQYRPAYPGLVEITGEQEALIEGPDAKLPIDQAMERVVAQAGDQR